MSDWVAIEMANGSARIPVYTPYQVPKLRPRPWIPEEADRSASLEGWGVVVDIKKSSRRRILLMSPRYKIGLCIARFLFAAEGCKALDSCGRLCVQRNLLSAALILSVAESVNMRGAYFRTIGIRFGGEMARQRASDADEFERLFSPGRLGVKEQARRERVLSSRGDIHMG